MDGIVYFLKLSNQAGRAVRDIIFVASISTVAVLFRANNCAPRDEFLSFGKLRPWMIPPTQMMKKTI
jgi:hypothetical protein